MGRLCFAVMVVCAAACSPAGLAGEAGRCPEQTAPVDALIDRTGAIVIAEPIADAAVSETLDAGLREVQDKAKDSATQGAAQDRMTAQLPIQLFSTIEYVKGEGPAEISVTTAFAPAEIRHDGPAHDAPAFWDNAAAGRGVLTANCGVAAAFRPGTRYLLFVGAPHVKAYEAVASENDPWLAYVRERAPERP